MKQKLIAIDACKLAVNTHLNEYRRLHLPAELNRYAETTAPIINAEVSRNLITKHIIVTVE